jgi:two-component system chemotaxis sensor kinase CheA
MDELLGEFLAETCESLDLIDLQLVRFEREPDNAEILNTIFRLVHTVKGTCGFLGLQRLAKLAHAAEALIGQYRGGAHVTVEGVTLILATIDRIKHILVEIERTGAEPPISDADLIGSLELAVKKQATPAEAAQLSAPFVPPGDLTPDELEAVWRQAPGPETGALAVPDGRNNGEGTGIEPQARSQTVRVSVDTLEHLMTTVSELVLTRNQLLELARHTGDSEFKTPLQRLSSVTAELQEGIMKARMQPIANAWQKLPRLVRELSLDLHKKIELDMTGGETGLDRQVLEQIKDPLTHMIRNSADHGLESPAERVRAGKPATGRIKLSAFQQGGYIVIEVADDGRGLSAEKIRSKALEAGLATQAELDRLSDAEIYKFIFRPGFSTVNTVTEVSGRGVGMDVVRSNIEVIGGTVGLKSTSPQGTVFIIKIPLTLAIMAALIVEVAGQRFAIPQFSVAELVRAGGGSEHQVELINDAAVLRLRDKLLPLIDLCQLLELDGTRSAPERVARDTLTVVVMQIGARRFGVLVDGVFHTEEIVVKPMSSLLRDASVFSGNTILGDGCVIMIVDPNALGSVVGSDTAQSDGPGEVRSATASAGEATTALLLFRAGSPMLKAVPLSLITRLEEIDRAAIEHTKGGDVVQYRGALMPLIYIDEGSRDRPSSVQPVLVFTEGKRPVGLAIDAIVDIVEAHLTIEVGSEEAGLVGAAIIKGKSVEIVDVVHYLGGAFGRGAAGKKDPFERGIKLLLVDDSQFFRNMLAPLLAASGYDVTLAGSADDVLKLKDQGACFDLIVTDLEMPGMDGIALAGHIKSDARWGNIPLIALSSHDSPRLVERTRAAGFATHVGKFDRQKLMDALADFCKLWGLAA